MTRAKADALIRLLIDLRVTTLLVKADCPYFINTILRVWLNSPAVIRAM